MRKHLLLVLVLSMALGCSNRGRDTVSDIGVEPVQDGEQQPLIETQDRDTADLEDLDITGLSGIGVLNPVFFEYDRFDITDDQMPMLTSNARVVADQGLPRIRVEGHCDERGTEEYNLALGDLRARAAKDRLVSLGIEPERIQTISFGESRPFEKAHDETAWSLNRRAHFVADR